MRQRLRDLKSYSVKRRGNIKEPDGTTSEEWGDTSFLLANIQPASGRVMYEMYGERLAYMLVAYSNEVGDLKESDGICVFVDSDKDPDYKVMAIKRWPSHVVLDLEKVRV